MVAELIFSKLSAVNLKKYSANGDFCETFKTGFIKSTIAQKMKLFIEDFFSKCDQIRKKLQIWSHLLKKSLVENLIFYAVHLYESGFISSQCSVSIPTLSALEM